MKLSASKRILLVILVILYTLTESSIIRFEDFDTRNNTPGKDLINFFKNGIVIEIDFGLKKYFSNETDITEPGHLSDDKQLLTFILHEKYRTY